MVFQKKIPLYLKACISSTFEYIFNLFLLHIVGHIIISSNILAFYYALPNNEHTKMNRMKGGKNKFISL